MPGNFTFEQLNLVIQYAFGWGGHHLYAFTPKGFGSQPSIERVSPDKWYNDEHVDLDSKKTKVANILTEKGNRFNYTYDFGDCWEHQIIVEAVLPEKAKHATLIAGKGKCPPDDCGGVWGYKDFLEIVNDPKHPEYEEMRNWAMIPEGKTWDTSELILENRAWRVKELPEDFFEGLL